MYHSVPVSKADALISALHGKVPPERTAHTFYNSGPEIVRLPAACESQVTVHNLLNVLQGNEVRCVILAYAGEIVPEPVALLGHPGYGSVTKVEPCGFDHGAHEHHSMRNGLKVSLVLM